MPAPETILQLVQRFDQHKASYRTGGYNETQLRREFLDPFFEALGWDVFNKNNYAEAYKDVIHEDAIKVGGATEAPDYAFRIGGTRKFFVEAKKPAVNVKEDISPAYQLRRYAWSSKLPLSILTDFEELAVYDCRGKPDKTDKASTGRILYYNYQDYLSRWDEISAIFSRDAVLKGSFDQYAEAARGKHGTAEVDDAFLTEIERWRDLLAHNIALRNPQLTQRELNYAVQMTIDRIIFLRICEDRGIEFYGELLALLNGGEVYARMGQLFQKADQRYNSGLFHFHPEKGEAGAPDSLTLGLRIDDKPLKDILNNLYYPDSPYEFSVLPADILGQVYEQFLGKVIRLTEGHHAVIEDKPEVKKAGGVYYTPTYIVEYIVRHTLGKLLEGKKPGERGAGKGEPLRVLDPACGSGSFLLGAYQYLLDWYRDGYTNDGPEKWAKGRAPALYQSAGGEWKLTTGERKRILLEHVYGVDIDPQAVEVTKLSLLLKVLEGESEQSLARQLSFFQERALPDLGQNVKCGNSLIGPDFYAQAAQQTSLLDDEEQYRINAFNWQREFAQVFLGSGGFDAVIGNPPYVRQEELKAFKEYFQRNFLTFHGVADLYTYFIERGVGLLKSGGLFSYIVANKWLRSNYGEPLRNWLKQKCIEEIIDFDDLPVFETATTYPCILRIAKKEPHNKIHVTLVKNLNFNNLEEYVLNNHYEINQSRLDKSGWALVDESKQTLLLKLNANGEPLGKYLADKVFYGIKTGLNDAFVIDLATYEKIIKDDPKSIELIKPFLMGRDINRYSQPSKDRFLICIPKGWTRIRSANAKDAWGWFKKNFPEIARHLAPFAEAANKRFDKGEFWWELRACEYYPEFEKPKIIIPAIVQNATYAYDTEGLYSNDKTSIIPTRDLYLLGLLNSKVCDFVMHNISSTKQGGYYEYKPMYVSKLPIRVIDFANPADVQLHDRMVALVERMLEMHKRLAAARTPNEEAVLKRQVETTDHQIDALVYELYGLSDEEVRLVEEAGK